MSKIEEYSGVIRSMFRNIHEEAFKAGDENGYQRAKGKTTKKTSVKLTSHVKGKKLVAENIEVYLERGNLGYTIRVANTHTDKSVSLGTVIDVSYSKALELCKAFEKALK